MKGNITKVLLLSSVLVAGIISPAQAQQGSAGMPGAYLYMGVGARALGMGGAYSAVANDATSTYWNPAGLAGVDPFQISFMHANLFVDTSLDFLAATAPTRNYGSFGLALLALTSGEAEQRTALNEVVGNFETRDMAMLLSWSKEVYQNIAIGVNYKLVNQKILNSSGSGHGIDLGVRAFLVDQLSASLVIRNLLIPKVTLAQESQSYPTQLSAGLARSFLHNNLTVSVEVSKINGWKKAALSLGGEYTFRDQFAFRLGLTDQSVTFGAGIALNAFNFGYGNAGHSELGSSHRFSLDYSFGGFGVGAAAEPKVFSPSGEFSITKVQLKVKSRTEIERWYLGIVDSNGRIVKQFEASGQPPSEIVWNGRNNAGALTTDGVYDYVFQARSVDGKEMNAVGQLVTIDSAGPVGIITSDGTN